MFHSISFANPVGLWALLAIPAILAAHFLQQRRRKINVSTLFLLEALSPRNIASNRLDRIRSSIPLVLQLTGAICLAALLAGPRILRKESHQRIFVVLDSSASMEAFRNGTVSQLTGWMQRAKETAKFTAWDVLESDSTLPPLYRGDSLAEATGSLGNWMPLSPGHDAGPTLLSARSNSAPQDRVVFVTDRKADFKLPPGVEVISQGSPIENMGITGVTFPDGQSKWEVLVRNFGTGPQQRQWWVESGTGRSQLTPVSLPPGGMVTLSGAFTGDRVILHLEPDGFPHDDAMPLVRPSRRVLKLRLASKDDLIGKFAGSLQDAVSDPAAGEPNLVLGGLNPADASPASTGAIVHLLPSKEAKSMPAVPPVAEVHPLTRDLDWRGLLYATPPNPFTLRQGDHALVWSGTHPLIFLREAPGGTHLMLNFDPALSNADRHPSLVLLLHRYAEEVRNANQTVETANFEINEALPATAPPNTKILFSADPAKQPEAAAAFIGQQAPRKAGFFDLATADGQRFLRGATHFGDSRESDFQAAETAEMLPAISKSQIQARATPLLPPTVWLLIMLACAAGYWSHPWRTAP